FILGAGSVAVCGNNYAILENENNLVPNNNPVVSAYQNITIPAGTTNLVFTIWAAKEENIEAYINFKFTNGPSSGTTHSVPITNLYTGPGSLVPYTISITLPSGAIKAEVRITSKVIAQGSG